MNQEWKAFLHNAGAEFDDGRVASFGNPEVELSVATTGEVLCDLSHYGLIAVQGDDAQSFLHAQFTNDLRQVSDTRSQLNAYCSPKGRVLASFRVFRRDGIYYLSLPGELLEPMLKRLRMFVLRARVAMQDAGDALARVGFSGPHAGQRLHDTLGGVPEQVDDALRAQEITVIRVLGSHPRYELYGEPQAMQKVWTALDVHAAPVGAAAWGLLDILAGVPTLSPQTMDEFVPQMINLQLIGGVSFTKGCYPGQEVVARMQYLGKLKRRMYRARIDADTRPLPGEPLYAPLEEAGQDLGKIVAAQPSPDGGWEVLAVVQSAAVASGAVRLGGAEGPRLTFVDLPYSFELEDTRSQPMQGES